MAINRNPQYDQTIDPPTDLEGMSGIYFSDTHFVRARICAQNMMIFVIDWNIDKYELNI